MAKKNDIIANCKKYLGTPYVWGGESKAEGGFDCSGYAYNVMKDSGMKVSRTTANGYRSIGKKIDIDDMRISDLLFFGKNNKATHIAFYAGDGMMYESMGSSKNTKKNPGRGVVLSKVSRRNDLMEVRRIADDALSSISTSTSTSADSKTKVTYVTHRIPNNKWGNEITGYNLSDSMGYSGSFGKEIDKVAIRLSEGKITYTAHRDGKWGNEINGYSTTDTDNYAGSSNKPIDAIAIKATGIKGKLKYRVHRKKDNKWGSWITGYSKTDTNNYAGSFGKSIDAIQIGIE